jgi:predicted methyltransferase
MARYVLSSLHLDPLKSAESLGQANVTLSLDLNLTAGELAIGDRGLILPDSSILTWPDIQIIRKKDQVCFAVGNGQIEAIQRYSERFKRSISLRPTSAAPTILIAGFPMHRIKDTTPDQDTAAKIKAASPLFGTVLDTTTGLGYTAIGASKTASSVITIELDPIVLEVARENPWSRDLFENPKITQLVGSSFERIHEFSEGQFNAVVHDPPTFSLAGELYSEEFYKQAFRVLRRGGKLFHYVGDLSSKQGHKVAIGAANRLRSAGFIKVERHPEAFALVALR